MFDFIRHRFDRSGRFGKRGLAYSLISLAGLLYEAFWDRPIEWFAVILWVMIFILGLYLLLIKKDSYGR